MMPQWKVLVAGLGALLIVACAVYVVQVRPFSETGDTWQTFEPQTTAPSGVRDAVQAFASAATDDVVSWPMACLADNLLAPGPETNGGFNTELEACCLANWGVEAKTGDSKPRVVTARIGTQVYRMAVYDQTDIVSNEIARLGSWEKKIVEDMLATLETLGVKGSSENNNNGNNNNNNNIDLLDIGGNIGWFSFALARHGFRAVAFEPFRQNRNLMKLTACLNPATAPRVTVYRHGLGEKADECELLSWVNHNQGNGVTRCRSQHNSPGTADYTVVDNISVRRFDDLLRGDTRRVNLLKIDTEGFELYALRGAVDMFSAPNRRPFALYTEFAPRMLRAHSADPADYLAFIKQQGLFCDDSQAYLDSNYAVYLKEIDARGGEVDLRCTRKL